jgi:hypothetical protein
MKLLKVAALSATLLAGGCATEMAWQRADGGPLDRGFAWAAANCRERARDNWREDREEAMQRCMRRHGYVWTSVAVAEPRRRHRDRYNDDYDDY